MNPQAPPEQQDIPASAREDLTAAASKPPTCAAPPATAAPLISTLPMDDVDFREIVEEFVERLGEKLSAMEQACGSGDLEELARLAHWLKGSGGTAGFDDFTTPARTLEEFAKQGQEEQILDAVNELRRLAARIEIPAETSA